MKPILLLITNLYNKDFLEDIELSQYLRKYFDVILSHPTDCQSVENHADIILIRNSWPAWQYEYDYSHMLQRFQTKGLNVYSDLYGSGEIKGKDHLVELYRLGYEVIPTVDRVVDLPALPSSSQYLIKPKNGCGSYGLEIISSDLLAERELNNYVIQPYLNFVYEISFYFIDNTLQYALYAPDKEKRWELVPYQPTNQEIALAEKFVHWNTMKHGIQRIDFCKMPNQDLLLMEIEDHNPCLSLACLDQQTRTTFLQNLLVSMQKTFPSLCAKMPLHQFQ